MRRSNSLLLALFTAFIAFPAIAQKAELDKRLVGKEKIGEIMNVVDDYYQEINEGVRKRTDEMHYKHWARWGNYMSSRTDENGNVVDVSGRVRKAHAAYTKTQGRSSNGNWFFRGPSAINSGSGSAVGIGRVDRIAFHPTDANTLYIGTSSGGVMKSTNDGASWTPLTDNLPSTAVSGIVVNYANANNVFILTGDGDASQGGFISSAGYLRSSAGVFVTYDGGINWYQTAPLPVTGAYAGYNLTQHPTDPGTLYAATDQGLYKTTNAGGSWYQVLSGRTYEVKFAPGISTIMYATQNGKFFRSLDAGETWTDITNFDFALPNVRVALSVTPVQANRVYLLSGWANGGSTYGGVFVSFDYGFSFTRQSNTPNIVESACDGTGGNNQSSYDLAIGVSTISSSIMVTGAVSTWRSSNTGSTWANVSAGRCGTNTSSTGYVHADVHDIEYNPLNGHVYLCSDGGLIKSTNNGTDWIDLSAGIVASQIYHMAGTPNNLDNMLIGLQDNGTKRRNANTNIWDQVLSADGYDCNYVGNSSTVGYLSWNRTVWRFTSNGGSNTRVSPTSAQTGFFPRVQTHNTNNNFGLFGYTDIFKTTTGDSAWTNTGAAGNWDIERCPSNSSRFYAAGSNSSAFSTVGSFYRSDDSGDNWTNLTGGVGYPTAQLRITDIAVRSNASANVWITCGGFSDGDKVFVSYDAGVSWTNLSGSLPNVPVNAIQVDQNLNAYIGTDIGVFYRGSGMSDWVPFWHNLPIVPVTDLVLYEAAGIIRAATFGRGVWESDTYSGCPQVWIINANVKGHRHYETWGWISSQAIIYGGQNTDVVFKAGGHVTLSTGFQVGGGNKFRAYTAPCGVVQN